MEKPTALITGASKGIGLELAHIFAASGYDLILVARDHSKLAELAKTLEAKHRTKSLVLALDLGLAETPRKIAQAAQDSGRHVDVLVNNAGFGLLGPFQTTSLDVELEMIQVNLSALVALTKHFLPEMVRRKRGRILQVASTAGFQPGPLMAVYYATKAFVLSFSEALAEELRGTGVTVTALCPGPTASEFQKVAKMQGSRLVGTRMDSAKMVAQAGYDAMVAGIRIVIPGARFKLLPFMLRFFPRAAVTRLVYLIQKQV